MELSIHLTLFWCELLSFVFVCFRWRSNVWRSTCLNEPSRAMHHLKILIWHVVKVPSYTLLYALTTLWYILTVKRSHPCLFLRKSFRIFLSKKAGQEAFLLTRWKCNCKGRREQRNCSRLMSQWEECLLTAAWTFFIYFVDRLWNLQPPVVGDMLFEMSLGLSMFIRFTLGARICYDVEKIIAVELIFNHLRFV